MPLGARMQPPKPPQHPGMPELPHAATIHHPGIAPPAHVLQHPGMQQTMQRPGMQQTMQHPGMPQTGGITAGAFIPGVGGSVGDIFGMSPQHQQVHGMFGQPVGLGAGGFWGVLGGPAAAAGMPVIGGRATVGAGLGSLSAKPAAKTAAKTVSSLPPPHPSAPNLNDLPPAYSAKPPPYAP